MAVINMYTLGRQEALEKYAAGKAGIFGRLFGAARKAGPPRAAATGKSRLRRAGDWLSDFAVGSPRRFMKEVQEGKALSKGSLIRESFKAPSLFDKALFYGLPAYEVGSIAGDKEGDKAKRLGESVGGAALSLAAFKPLGLAGAIGGGLLGGAVGGGVGTAVGNATGLGNNTNTAPYGGPPEGIRY